ncbi:fungal-specific transcription factor domain-containing protein [Colletotrichum lupini]|nr:fungal-specific transcription factor domain-containing protein [Colletotrichum lupini]
MKPPKACRQCRESKRKCLRRILAVGEPCDTCRARSLPCASSLSRVPPSPLPLLPRPEPAPSLSNTSTPTSTKTEGISLPLHTAVLLVDYYLDKLHNRPHSLFHPAKLRQEVQDGSISRILLLAICSMGSRFALDEETRALEAGLMEESKRMLLANLENVCVENIQACILIANLCAAHLNPSSEALFFRTGISLSHIMQLGTSTVGTRLVDLEIHRRIWWSLFMADRWSSSSLRLLPQIRDTELAVDLPMDEAIFQSLDPTSTQLEKPWQPGIWAFKISLVQLFGPIQQLNRHSVNRSMTAEDIESSIHSLSQQLETWEKSLPNNVKWKEEMLDWHINRGTGGPYVALHLGYHHYSVLLYFRFLSSQEPRSSAASMYHSRCKSHASAYSNLVKLARGKQGCEVVYPTVGHMAVVSSSMLLHTLLFGEEADLKSARDALNANFAAIVELRQYWPNTAPMIERLATFQNFCLLSGDSRTHDFDDWMVRFLTEYSLPLEEKDIQHVRSGMDYDIDSFSARTQVLTQQGRYTSFQTDTSDAYSLQLHEFDYLI